MSSKIPKTYKRLSLLLFAIAAAVISPIGMHIAYAGGFWEGVKGLFSAGGEALAWVIAGVLRLLIFEPSGWIVRGAAFVFDTVVPFSLGTGASNAFQSAFITEGWGLMRDITNMVFIFAMLYIAIATILQVGAGRNTKALIVNIILIALFVNFSLFLAQVVIDAANLLAYEFYKALTSASDHGLAAIFITGFNPQSLLGTASFNDWVVKYNASYSSLIFIYLFGGTVQLIAAYMIFLASFLFIGRIVILWILMIVSPIAFAAYIIPAFQGKFREWWDRLLKQAFVAPIFLFFFYIFALFVEPGGGLSVFIKTTAEQASAGDALTTTILKILLGFSLVVAFLVVALKMTKSLSGEVAGFATKAAGFSIGAAATMVAGPAGAARLQKIMGAVGAPTGGMGAGAAVGRVTGVPLRPLREAAGKAGGKAREVAGAAAKGVVEAGTKQTLGGKLLRTFGIARGAGKVEAAAKAGSKAAIEKSEKDLEGLSDNALRTEYGDITSTAEKRAAIIKILGKRKKLQPQKEGEGPMTHDSIVETLKTVKGRGYDTEKEVENPYLWQYATTDEEREKAAKTITPDAMKEMGKMKRKVTAKELSPEELKKIGEARGKEVGADEELELPSNFFDAPEVFDIAIKNMTSAHFKMILDPEVRGDFSKQFVENLKAAMERKKKEVMENMRKEGKTEKEVADFESEFTADEYFKRIQNTRAAIKDPSLRNFFDDNDIPYKEEKTKEKTDKEKTSNEDQKKKDDEERARKEKEKFYQEFYGGGENTT